MVWEIGFAGRCRKAGFPLSAPPDGAVHRLITIRVIGFMQNKYYPHLASPITIKGLTFKNRIFGAPMSNPEMDPDSHMRKEDVAFHENRARGGLASVAIGLGIVDAVGRTHTKEVALYDFGSLPSLKEASKAMHRHGCNAVMELAHGGKYANARGHGQAAERYALGPNDEVNPDGLPVRSMTEEQILQTAEAFGRAAGLVKQAGFDMVLIHGGHGWLLGQFMSPSMNHRTDRWGGSLENRMRFPLLVIEKVREAVGGDFPIEFRMSGAELTKDGYGLDEGIAMAKAIDGKVDIIHVCRARLQCLPGGGDQKACQNAGSDARRAERPGYDGGDHRIRQGGHHRDCPAVDLRPLFPGKGVFRAERGYHPVLPLLYLLLQLPDEPHVLLRLQPGGGARAGELFRRACNHAEKGRCRGRRPGRDVCRRHSSPARACGHPV